MSKMLRRCWPRLQAQRRAFSVDQHEVDKFSKIGSTWWDSSSSSGAGPLHHMNPVRVNFIRSQMAALLGRESQPALDHLKGLRVLDVGCGGGLLSEALARLGANVTAIDPSEKNIAVAKEHASGDPLTASISYLHSTVEDMAKSESKFDMVCTLEVIEHTPNPRAFLLACTQCLSDNGSLFVSTVNRTQKAYWLTIAAAEDLLGMVPRGTHHWDMYITPDEMTSMLEQSLGMDVLSTKGMVPDLHLLGMLASPCPSSALKHWKLSDKDLDVNYIMHSVKKMK